MADDGKLYQLIITGPGNNPTYAQVRDYTQAFRDNIPNFLRTDIDGPIDAMQTGLPYHLPYSFEHDAANEFMWQLEAAGCTVRLTDVGA